MSTQFALPASALVLVTGANGYIGSHIVDTLLSLEYRVRGTVREEKAWLNEFFDKKYGKGIFETAVVPDIQAKGAYDAVLEGVDGIVHTAADMSMSTDPNAVIPATKQATVNILKSATEHAGIKRVVLTSSSTAAIVERPNAKAITIDEKTWNDDAIAAAWSDETPHHLKGYFVYAASKTEGERAAWEWHEKAKPGFVLNTVLPNCNFGKVLVPQHQRGSTMTFLRNFWPFGTATSRPWTGCRRKEARTQEISKLTAAEYYIDVRDTARLHVAALLDPLVNGERIFGFAHAFNWTDTIQILRRLRPQRTFRDPPKDEGRDHTEVKGKQRAEELLKNVFGRPGWTSLEDCIAEGIEDLP